MFVRQKEHTTCSYRTIWTEYYPKFLHFLNCLRSLEQQVKETFDLAKKSSESQSKGELALQDVNKAI